MIESLKDTAPLGFDPGFFMCPKLKESLGPIGCGLLIQAGLFFGGEKPAGDRPIVEVATNLFHINPDFLSNGEGIEGQTTGMRKIKAQIPRLRN